MKVAAAIIARIGSTRLPRKNLKVFCGKPLVEWSFLAAKNSKYVDDVYLSTDSDEIADLAIPYGVKVFRRPLEDSAISGAVPTKNLAKYIHSIDPDVDTIVGMLPTSPTRFPDDIDRGIELYKKVKKAVVTMAVNKETILNFLDKEKQLSTTVCYDKGFNYGTCTGSYSVVSLQDLLDMDLSKEMTDKENTEKIIRQIKDGTIPTVYYVPVKDWQSFDIDYLDDFILLETLMKQFILKDYQNPYYEYKKSWMNN